MLKQIPKDLPLFFALSTAAAILVYGFTGMHLGMRPSSTSALGVIFIPLWSGITAVIAYLLGYVIRFVWRTQFTEPAVQPWHGKVLAVLLGCIMFCSALMAWYSVQTYEKAAKPNLVTYNGELVPHYQSSKLALVRTATSVYGRDQQAEPIQWGKNQTLLSVNKADVELRDRVSNQQATVSVAGLDYVTQYQAARIKLAGFVEPGLAMLIDGRATGKRSLLVVLTPDYKVFMRFMVERYWPLQSSALEIRLDPVDGEVIAVGAAAEEKLLISLGSAGAR